jgi:hypothetical protein
LESAQVLASTELAEIALRHGHSKKRNNAIVAALSAGLPATLLSFHFPANFPFTWKHWLLGMAIGLLWGNGFEYAYHRWLLHRPRCQFAKGHLEHHINVGTPDQAEHVSLGKSPVHIALLFASNGIPLIALDFLFGLGITPGIFVGWAAYLMTAEEIHWRIHLDGWLPPGLRFARRYHMAHHDVPNSRYNVFLPVFDLIFGSSRTRARQNFAQVKVHH